MKFHLHVYTKKSLSSLPFCGLQYLSMGHKQVILASTCLMGFFLHKCIIYGPPSVSHARFFIHGNLAPHHCLAPLTILFCLVFLKIIFVWTLWASKYAIYCLRSNCKRNLDNLFTFTAYNYEP